MDQATGLPEQAVSSPSWLFLLRRTADPLKSYNLNVKKCISEPLFHNRRELRTELVPFCQHQVVFNVTKTALTLTVVIISWPDWLHITSKLHNMNVKRQYCGVLYKKRCDR